MKNLGYYNGKVDEIENIYIPMNDRACYFGDGVYDATYSRNYKIFDIELMKKYSLYFIEKESWNSNIASLCGNLYSPRSYFST